MAKIGTKTRTGGPKTKEGKAKAIANLKPPWTSKTAPTGPGRPANAGLSLQELLNQMKGWPREKYKEIIDDPKESGERVAAALRWYYATSTDTNASGMPVSAPDFDRICDRTEGKPSQAIEHSGKIDSVTSQIDLSDLSDDELLRFERAFENRIRRTETPGRN